MEAHMNVQLTLPTICCGRTMHGHGSAGGRVRRMCPVCGKTRTDKPLHKHRRVWITNGRRRIQLGLGHPYANSAGWQYFYRYVVADSLQRPLSFEEHVHHKDLDSLNDHLSNLELRLSSGHGRFHRQLAILTEFRQGKLFELDHPVPITKA
jgi:hypothetical protein